MNLIAIKDYAEPIINSIEKEEKYFSFKFYREHTIIINNFFVKDISLIGRDINKIIIVDNLPQNFILQKENGILIKSFYGENKEDNSLFNLLKILIRIYNEGNDVRNSIKKYKNEILRKVTSSIDIENDL
jgi:CTD small phosphatase-like protein 2